MQEYLQREQVFYDSHKAEIVKNYLGKQVLIYKDKVQGAFDNFSDAFAYAKRNKFTPAEFMIKPVLPEDEALQFISVMDI